MSNNAFTTLPGSSTTIPTRVTTHVKTGSGHDGNDTADLPDNYLVFTSSRQRAPPAVGRLKPDGILYHSIPVYIYTHPVILICLSRFLRRYGQTTQLLPRKLTLNLLPRRPLSLCQVSQLHLPPSGCRVVNHHPPQNPCTTPHLLPRRSRCHGPRRIPHPANLRHLIVRIFQTLLLLWHLAASPRKLLARCSLDRLGHQTVP